MINNRCDARITSLRSAKESKGQVSDNAEDFKCKDRISSGTDLVCSSSMAPKLDAQVAEIEDGALSVPRVKRIFAIREQSR